MNQECSHLLSSSNVTYCTELYVLYFDSIGSTIGLFTRLTTNVSGVLCYTFLMVTMSLGDRNSSDPLYSFGTTIVYALWCWLTHPYVVQDCTHIYQGPLEKQNQLDVYVSIERVLCYKELAHMSMKAGKSKTGHVGLQPQESQGRRCRPKACLGRPVFCPSQASPDWMRPTHIAEGAICFTQSSLIKMLISSQNTFHVDTCH